MIHISVKSLWRKHEEWIAEWGKQYFHVSRSGSCRPPWEDLTANGEGSDTVRYLLTSGLGRRDKIISISWLLIQIGVWMVHHSTPYYIPATPMQFNCLRICSAAGCSRPGAYVIQTTRQTTEHTQPLRI